MKNIYFQSIGVWLIFGFLTIFFGAFREIVFIPMLNINGDLSRTLLLPLAFFYLIGITYLFLKRTKANFNNKDMIKVGLLWFVMTIIFEFIFGIFVMGNSLKNLLNDYNLVEGKTWSLFLICLFLSPTIVYKYILRKKSTH